MNNHIIFVMILTLSFLFSCKKEKEDDKGLLLGAALIAGQSTTLSANTEKSETVATPTFSPTAGTYTSAQNVTISSTTSGAEIRYTTDGSEPTCSTGTVYSAAVSVTATTTLKAVGCKTGMTASSVASALYTIQYTLGGTVSGLTGTVVLTNGSVDKSISASGSYTFDAAVNSGSSYTVTVKTQPSSQTCTVSNGTGTANATVSNIDVSCGVPCLEGRPGGTETYAWGTFTDQCNGTLKFVGVAGNFGGQDYTAQTLTFMKCTQGQTWNSGTNDCTGTGDSGTKYGAVQKQFCSSNDSTCDNGTVLTSGALFDSCNTLSFAGKGAGSWRVTTKNELKTLIHCTNKTMPNDLSSCGNYTFPSINHLFPNTVVNYYWSSSSSSIFTAFAVSFINGNVSYYSKTNTVYVRCVLSGQ